MPAVDRTAADERHATPPVDGTQAPALVQRGRNQDQAFFNLPALPPDLRGEVARRLAPRSAAALILTSRDMQASFGDAARAARLSHEARTADLPAIERLLMDRAGLAALPAVMRIAPGSAAAARLGELTLQLKDLPEQARTAAFDKILSLAGQITGPASATPLKNLAAAIPGLPEPHRHAGFAALLAHATRMPDADRLVLEVQLAKVVQTLPTAHRAATFRQVLIAAGGRAGDSRRNFSQALRHQLLHLPAADQLAAFRSLVDRSRGPGVQKAWEANHLVSYVHRLPMAARHEALTALAHRLCALADDDQIRLVAALPLAQVIRDLPPSSRDEAAHRIADVLQPLGQPLHTWLLKRPDTEVPPAVKEALRQAPSRGAGGNPTSG